MNVEIDGNKNFDLLTVGCGPVGLAQTVHTTLSNLLKGCKLSVLMLDKRESYVRGHTVKLDKKSIQKAAIKTDDLYKNSSTELKKTIDEYNQILSKFQGHTPISDIEEKLHNFAKNCLNFTILKGEEYGVSEERTINHFIDQYKPKSVILAGGAHCLATKQVFGTDHLKEKKTLGRLIQLKFKKKNDLPLPKFIDVLKSNSLSYGRYTTLTSQSKKVDEEGYSKAQTFISITSSEYHQLREEGKATFNHPASIEDLLKSESSRLKHIAHISRSTISQLKGKDPEMVAVELSSYRSKEYGKNHCTENGTTTTVFKAGDAAGGVPFERSLSGSLNVVPRCSEAIDKVVDESCAETEKKKAIETYNKKADKIWKSEASWAGWKSYYIRFGDFCHRLFSRFLNIGKKIISKVWKGITFPYNFLKFKFFR